jgi:D-xylonolactonase
MSPDILSSGFRAVGEVRCQLGEGPLWSARDNAIYWVDILAPAIHRYSLATEAITTWAMPEKVGWIIERRNRPGFIAGFQSGFYELALDPTVRTKVVDPEPHLPSNRMNDAKVDRLGRIWAGTMDCEGRAATGSLYRLDGDFSVTRHDAGYFITNGPAFGPEDECMYHTDTGRGVVYRFALGADGSLGPRSEFLKFPAEWGSPDGMTVDADGKLWIAHWGGGRLSRFSAHAVCECQLQLPASQITSCVFAGSGLERLFVTSAAVDRPDEAMAGALFEIDTRGSRGLPPRSFAG